MSASTPCPAFAPSYEPRLEEIEGWAHEFEALHARIAPASNEQSPAGARWPLSKGHVNLLIGESRVRVTEVGLRSRLLPGGGDRGNSRCGVDQPNVNA